MATDLIDWSRGRARCWLVMTQICIYFHKKIEIRHFSLFLFQVGRNDLMVSQTIQNFIEVGEPKIQATENLDKASRALCACVS
jgi:hypothetical protein